MLIATDDQRVVDVANKFAENVVMTSTEHQTGTDRIAEAIADIDADIILNVQGDEPLIPTDVLDQLLEQICQRNCEMATVAVPISADSEGFNDPNVVKVVVGSNDMALYFSRASIPFARDDRPLNRGTYGVIPTDHDTIHFEITLCMVCLIGGWLFREGVPDDVCPQVLPSFHLLAKPSG